MATPRGLSPPDAFNRNFGWCAFKSCQPFFQNSNFGAQRVRLVHGDCRRFFESLDFGVPPNHFAFDLILMMIADCIVAKFERSCENFIDLPNPFGQTFECVVQLRRPRKRDMAAFVHDLFENRQNSALAASDEANDAINRRSLVPAFADRDSRFDFFLVYNSYAH